MDEHPTAATPPRSSLIVPANNSITIIPPTPPHTPLLNPVNPVNPVQNFYTLNTIYTAIIFSFRVFRGSILCVLCNRRVPHLLAGFLSAAQGVHLGLHDLLETTGSDLIATVNYHSSFSSHGATSTHSQRILPSTTSHKPFKPSLRISFIRTPGGEEVLPLGEIGPYP